MLVIFASITAFSEMLLGSARLKLFRFLIIFGVTAGLSSFWYNPQFSLSMAFGPLGEGIRETAVKLIPVSFFTVPVLGAFGYLLFDRKPNLQQVFLASFYTIVFAFIVWAGGGFFPSSPSRYAPEFGVSLSFLLAIGLVKLTDYMRFLKNTRFAFLSSINKKMLANGFLLLVTVLLILVIISGQVSLTETGYSVLGFWTGVERGEIWLARERVSAISLYSGYAISLTTVLLLILLEVKAKVGRKELQTR